jgi:hypothetical protein
MELRLGLLFDLKRINLLAQEMATASQRAT